MRAMRLAPRILLGLIGRRLPVNGAPIITIVGKAFWDIGHAPSDQSNTRKRLPDYPVWQIHRVMNWKGSETVGLLRRNSSQFSVGLFRFLMTRPRWRVGRRF